MRLGVYLLATVAVVWVPAFAQTAASNGQPPGQGNSYGGAYAVRPAPWLRATIEKPSEDRAVSRPSTPTQSPAPMGPGQTLVPTRTIGTPMSPPSVGNAGMQPPPTANQARIEFDPPARVISPVRPSGNSAVVRAGAAVGSIPLPSRPAGAQRPNPNPQSGSDAVAVPRIGMTIPDPPPGTIAEPVPERRAPAARAVVPPASSQQVTIALPSLNSRQPAANASVPSRVLSPPTRSALAPPQASNQTSVSRSPRVAKASAPLPRTASTPASPATNEPRADLSRSGPLQAAPPRQDVRQAAASASRRSVDASNPENFRGPDGMIDAAAMRRAQLAAAGANGQPAYSVQREWEAVEAERQRARAAGEQRVDPLAGTVPVPETAQERRAREREEARQNSEQRGDDPESDNDQVSELATPAKRGSQGATTAQRRPAKRQELAQASQAPTRQRARQPKPPRLIDREPKLDGGPG
jgi:hypothetical protein